MADAKTKEDLRVICDGHYGTVKFFGEVPPSSGLWYGIEWDEDGRGKHNGVHEAVEYFECSRPCSGSFVRARKVDFGVSAVEGLRRKFDDLHDGEEQEELQFFYRVGSNDVNDVDEKLRQLKHINLRATNISCAGVEEPLLGSIVPNIVELDLSKTLLSDWQEVLKIIKDLPRLSKLDVSENRLKNLGKYYDESHETVKYSKKLIPTSPLKILVANKMNLNWHQVLTLAACFGGLEELHASYNNIESLHDEGRLIDDVKNLRKIDIQGNNLSNWSDILLLRVLPNLESLVLNDTKLDGIYFADGEFLNLKYLFLSKTMVSNWSSINQLNRLVALEVLSLQDCPLVQSISEYEARCELIARMAKCLQLNKSNVTAKERQISERAYVKSYGKDWLASGGGNPNNIHSNIDGEFTNNHPRYLCLIESHGAPEGIGGLLESTSLKDTLIAVTIMYVTDTGNRSVAKKLPRTMTVSKLKGMLQRLFKVQTVRQRLTYVDETGHEVEMDDDLRSLSFYSLESGGTIQLRLK